MNIHCKHCGQYFCPDAECLDLIAEGYISSSSVKICDDCWDLIQLSEYDYADPGSDA